MYVAGEVLGREEHASSAADCKPGRELCVLCMARSALAQSWLFGERVCASAYSSCVYCVSSMSEQALLIRRPPSVHTWLWPGPPNALCQSVCNI